MSTSSAELNLNEEVHALLALLVNQHVKSWYAPLTQDEELFELLRKLIDELHTRLAVRFRAVDWTAFFMDTLPELVLLHLEDFNRAQDRCSGANIEGIFLSMTPDYESDFQDHLIAIAEGLMAILLPYEDLVSDVAYSFLRELLADLILRNLLERLSEPWHWHEVFIKLLTKAGHEEERVSSKRKLEVILQALSSNVLPYLHTYRNKDDHLPPYKSSVYDTALPEILRQMLTPTDRPITKQIVFALLLPVMDFAFGGFFCSTLERSLVRHLNDAALATIVRLSRRILFPNDEPTPFRIEPTSEEQRILKDHAKELLMIDLPFLDYKIINKVFLIKVLDLSLGTIFPELRTRTPQQLKSKVLAVVNANKEAVGHGGISTGRFHRPLSTNDNT